jgi:hypothetical protein
MQLKLKRKFFKLLIDYLPKTQLFDKILSFIQFSIVHKRLPTNKNLFNDKFYQIKISNEIVDPLRVFITDKEYLKIYLSSVIEKKFIIPTLQIINLESEVDNIVIKENCIIKPTHLGGGKCIIKKLGEKLSQAEIHEIKNWFRINLYFASRERNHLFLKPKVIIEPLVFNDDNITDFKFFCYKGKSKLIVVDLNRSKNHLRGLYDSDWNRIENISIHHKAKIDINNVKKPSNFELMTKIAEKLSKTFEFIRVDLYSNDKEIYVGEITNLPGGALAPIIPKGLASEKIISKIIFE